MPPRAVKKAGGSASGGAKKTTPRAKAKAAAAAAAAAAAQAEKTVQEEVPVKAIEVTPPEPEIQPKVNGSAGMYLPIPSNNSCSFLTSVNICRTSFLYFFVSTWYLLLYIFMCIICYPFN